MKEQVVRLNRVPVCLSDTLQPFKLLLDREVLYVFSARLSREGRPIEPRDWYVLLEVFFSGKIAEPTTNQTAFDCEFEREEITFRDRLFTCLTGRLSCSQYLEQVKAEEDNQELIQTFLYGVLEVKAQEFERHLKSRI